MSAMKRFDDLKITLEAIKSATDNFSDDSCIGHGGFGKVYKGELAVNSKGRIMAAFKRLDRSFGQGNPEFWKEIALLSHYKHENVVSLLGFCDEDGEKILMYPYASNNSLEKHLKNPDLTWIKRLKICIGAARGLAYLHNPDDTQQRVLHRDIKSGNILLDESWNAKISDFGLSKIGPANQENTFIISNVVGTLGYCDPQYMATGLVTKATDVYSFGVVLFEVLCGRLCTSNDKNLDLARLARTSYEQNRMMEIVYKHIKDQIGPDSLKFFTEIAYQCLKIDDQQRPLMTEVVKALERALDSTVSRNEIEMIKGAFLNIGPPQLNFISPYIVEFGKMIRCTVHLENMTDHHVAYQIQGGKENKYFIGQFNGIVLPCSTKKLFVEISGHKQASPGMRCNDVVTILTAVASPGAKPEDMVEMFNEESENKVEICNLKINLIDPSPPEMFSEMEMITGDLLNIRPRILRFHFELKKQISCFMQLENVLDSPVAFKVKTTDPKNYYVRPCAGIVLPFSTLEIQVTMQAQETFPPDMQCRDKFLIQSFVVSPGTKTEDFTTEMFHRLANQVKEQKMRVEYIPPQQSLYSRNTFSFQWC